MLEPPCITGTDEQLTASLRLTIPREEIRDVMGPGITEVYAAIAAQGLEVTGPWLTHHFRMDPEVFDFEICVPVATPIEPVGRVRPGVLPAATVARALMRGPYEGLPAAWGELDAWVTANGHRPADDLWECYTKGPESGNDPSEWLTELNRPLRSRG